MIEVKNVELDGLEFQLSPLPIRSALRLDKKLVEILAPILAKLVDGGQDLLKMEIQSVAVAIQAGLASIDDNEFVTFVLDCLSTTSCITGKVTLLNSEKALGEVFSGNLMGIYKLVFEVCRFNKFTPFALGGLGLKSLETDGSPKPEEKP